MHENPPFYNFPRFCSSSSHIVRSVNICTEMSDLKISDWTCDYFINNESTCRSCLEVMDLSTGLPSLNWTKFHNLRDGQLVRFRGMIQDMYDPEYYFKSYEVKNTSTDTCTMRSGMYKDTAKCQENEEILLDSKNNNCSQRHTIVVISTPGLNEWAAEKSPQHQTMDYSSPNVSSKRPLDEEQDEVMQETSPRKREKLENNHSAVEKPNLLSEEHLLNFPVYTKNGCACIVKIYEENASFKLNQVVDIVGFVSLDPMLSTFSHSEEMMDDVEVQTHNPPSSLIPRLHAVMVAPLLATVSISCASEIMSKARLIRNDLQTVISQLLFGDVLAADFVICHLLSRIYMRKNDLCLGNFPLNIVNFPTEAFPNFTKDFYAILTNLVSKSHYFECTLENLNNLSMVPKKDYECNRLTSGVLQLSNNTHLVIDETKLTTGQLSAAGRKNYNALKDLVTFQKVTYDFTYYTMEFEADVPVLILSQAKSFIPNVIHVPVKVSPEVEMQYVQIADAAKKYLMDETCLRNIQQYFELLRQTDFEFGEQISGVIQEDFVRLRQLYENVTADNLHSLMVLARLMGLSYGETSLTLERWKETLDMEIERQTRLRQRVA